MTKKKIKKVKFEEGALDNVPEEDREEIVEELKKMFLEGDPSTMGEPLEKITSGKTDCPHCGSALLQGPVLKIPSKDDTLVRQVFDCKKCDKAFIGTPIN